jgi:hypothetical protein
MSNKTMLGLGGGGGSSRRGGNVLQRAGRAVRNLVSRIRGGR